MNLTVNLTQSLLYTGTECTTWCSSQIAIVENSLGHGELILLSLVCFMGYYIFNNIDAELIKKFGVHPKDAYAREQTFKKVGFGLLDASFLIQIAFLVVHVIKGLIA